MAIEKSHEERDRRIVEAVRAELSGLFDRLQMRDQIAERAVRATGKPEAFLITVRAATTSVNRSIQDTPGARPQLRARSDFAF